MARREVNVFSVSFLDCIFCGFGAVVLLFVIVNARATMQRMEKAVDLRAAVQQLQRDLLEGRKDFIVVRNAKETTEQEWVETRGAADRIEKTLEEKQEELAQYEDTTLSREEHVNRLRSDLESMETDYQRLRAAATAAQDGTRIKSFPGDGERQYLTGIRVGGERILILVDASASMLGDKLVDIIIRRNLPEETRRASRKWRRVVDTVDWLTAQFPATSRFQIYVFNETSWALIEGSDGDWLECGDPEKLKQAMEALREITPDKGTSFHAAFGAIAEMRPRPDNLFLLTDGLPTMPERRPNVGRVSATVRQRYYQSAIRELPRDLSVNTILFPMEGDPMAAPLFWRLANSTRGSFFVPSEDWP